MAFKKGHKAVAKKVAPKKEVKKPTPKAKVIEIEAKEEEDEIDYEHVDVEESVFTLPNSTGPSKEIERRQDYGDLEDLMKAHTFEQTDTNPNMTEVDDETMSQLKELRKFESMEKEVRKEGSKMNFYPSATAASKQKAEEDYKNLIIDFFMTQKSLSFLEARAKMEELKTAGELYEVIFRKLEAEAKAEAQVTKVQPTTTVQGVQTQEIKRTIKYY